MRIPNFIKVTSLSLGTLAVFLGGFLQLFATNNLNKDTLFVAERTIIHGLENLKLPIITSNIQNKTSNNYLFVTTGTVIHGLESIVVATNDAKSITSERGAFFVVENNTINSDEPWAPNNFQTKVNFQKTQRPTKSIATVAHPKKQQAKTEALKISALPWNSQPGNWLGLLNHNAFALLVNTPTENHTKDKPTSNNYFSTILDSVTILIEKNSICQFADNTFFANAITLTNSIWPNAPPIKIAKN